MKFFSGPRPVLTAPSDQIHSLVLAGLAAIILGGGTHMFTGSDIAVAEAPAPVVAAATAVPAVTEVEETGNFLVTPEAALASVRALANDAAVVVNAKPEPVSRQIEVKRGHTLAQILADADVAENDALAVATAMRKVYDLKRIRAGNDMTLHFTRHGPNETFDGLTFQPDLTNEVTVARNAAGNWEARKLNTPLERRRFAAAGEINSSFYGAGDRAGVPMAVMAALIRIYSHEVDFQRDLQPGDRFEVMYDQPMTKAGQAVGEGTVIFAALDVGGKRKPVYRVVFSDNTAEYFNERGESARRALLRTPVDGARVTSRFGMRAHPILGYSKMHKGVDFGAPIGTPIFAAGNGVIEQIGFNGAYGRYIRIRHNGKMTTAYAHMSRFARGLKRGDRVGQGDVIGYVGSSGRSTGSHLHYEVMVNRSQVNPLSVNMSAGRTLDGKMLAKFKAGIKDINAEYANTLAGRAPDTIRVASSQKSKQ